MIRVPVAELRRERVTDVDVLQPSTTCSIALHTGTYFTYIRTFVVQLSYIPGTILYKILDKRNKPLFCTIISPTSIHRQGTLSFCFFFFFQVCGTPEATNSQPVHQKQRTAPATTRLLWSVFCMKARGQIGFFQGQFCYEPPRPSTPHPPVRLTSFFRRPHPLPRAPSVPPVHLQECERCEGQQHHVPRHGSLPLRLSVGRGRLLDELLLRVHRVGLQRGPPRRPRVHNLRHFHERLPGENWRGSDPIQHGGGLGRGRRRRGGEGGERGSQQRVFLYFARTRKYHVAADWVWLRLWLMLPR